MDTPFYPIVYIRGYAGSQAEVEETVADPYMGFNIGSTKIRQRWTGTIDRYVFESPLIRLMKDHGYEDAYSSGTEVTAQNAGLAKRVWIYRYYEPVSEDLGNGARPEMEDYAKGLDTFLRDVRERMCGNDTQRRADFRVYLVAHSMGGLVARCYLQLVAPNVQDPVAVDKVYTYATPHGGIDFRLIGNIPAFVRYHNTENFNEDRMRGYLGLKNTPQIPVTSLDGKFPAERFFCLVGTDSRDYTVAGGLSSFAVGPMSDGLVQIKNAAAEDAPRAFVHRSHSGQYGIVNSEEGYQNLTRFLFGDVRVVGSLDVREITLPPAVERARAQGKKVRASYHIEVIASVRGARWDLHRRTVQEESAIFRKFEDLVRKKSQVTLFTSYLAEWAAVNKRRRTLGFAVDLRILVPDYEIDGALIFDQHYEGGYLFRDKVNLEVKVAKDLKPQLNYGWDSVSPNRVTRNTAAVRQTNGGYEFRMPIAQPTRPGMKGELVLLATPWQ